MNRLRFYSILLFMAVLGSAFNAHATSLVAINQNLNSSISNMPGLFSGLSYVLGLLLGIVAIVKLKQHVEDPRSTPLREPVIRFLAGGALLAIPSIYTAAMSSIYGGTPAADIFGDVQTVMNNNTQLAGATFTENFNSIIRNIILSISNTPALLSGVAYMIGLVMGINGVLKIKDHVQSPENVPLRDGIIRLLGCGAFLATPSIFEALLLSFEGTGSVFTELNQAQGALNTSGEAGTACAASGPPGSVGAILCNLYSGSAAFPRLLTASSYIFGIVLGMWGLFKIKEHVVDPRNSLWEGVVRLIASGAFFALPTIIEAIMETLITGLDPHRNTGFTGVAAALGLDRMMANFVTSIFGPLDIMINFFGYVAGAVLIMIGISRLLKSSQEGARGPGGIGTIMTFIAGGALLSFSPMISAFTMSMFNSPTVTRTALVYRAGLTDPEVEHIHAVISAMLKFVLILGLISFMRGIFIIRGVAEGNQQASMMAGVTHLVGGALAVNLGPFLNAVQTTLGIAGFGVNFT